MLAFARRRRSEWAVVAVAWLGGSLGSAFPVGRRAWGDDVLPLSASAPREWIDALTHAELSTDAGSLPLEAVFGTLPVALLVPRPMLEGR